MVPPFDVWDNMDYIILRILRLIGKSLWKVEIDTRAGLLASPFFANCVLVVLVRMYGMEGFKIWL